MAKAIIYPKAPKAGIPQILGFISVVHIMLELISSAMTQSHITTFRMSRRKSRSSSGAAYKSRFTRVCPFI